MKHTGSMPRRMGAGILAVILILALSACANTAGTAGTQNETPLRSDTGGVAVQVASVRAETIATDSKVSGQLASEDEATIMVAVSARCTATYVRAGDTVRRGQILCKLDLDSTLSQYSAVQISYDSAVQSYNDQKALLDQQIAMAKEDIAAVDGQIKVTQDQIKLAENQIPILQQHIPMAEKQIPIAEKQIEMAEKQIPMAEQQIAYMEEQLAVLNTQITQAEKTVRDTEALLAIGAAAQSDLDNAKLNLDNQKVQKLSLEYNIEQVRLSLDNAQISLENAQLNLDNAQLNVDNAKLALQQQQSAIEQSKYALSQQQLSREKAQLQLQAQETTRTSTLAQLEAGIENARSSVQQMSNVLEDVDQDGNVIAPISGILASFNATENNYISSAMPLAVINGEDRMKVSVSVSEALVPKLSIGDSADVYLTALDRSFSAEIRSVERAANQQTRLYTVTLEIPPEIEGVLAGMFADVTFHTDRVDHAIVIPSEAVLTSGAAQYVYIVQNGIAKYVEITTGLTGTGVTEVLSGLEGGEQLIVVGQSYVQDGASVRIVGTAS